MPAKGTSAQPVVLRVAGQPPPERADAARNRQALLDAASRIMVARGVDALSMDHVAAEAGVGVGTVYRRFGDRAGLLYALLDESERQFQAAFLSGPPPVGPGAPPAVRIHAFLHAVVDLLESQGDLHAFAESQSPTARFRNGAHWARRAHLVSLVGLVDRDVDAVYVADALLAAVGAGLVLYQRRELGFSAERVKAGIDQVLDGIAPCPDQ